MVTIDSGATGRGSYAELKPLAITVKKACELSGYGPTTIWGLLKSGRLKAVRLPGVRRTTIDYSSFVKLIAPPADPPPRPRRRGRPRKHADAAVTV